MEYDMGISFDNQENYNFAQNQQILKPDSALTIFAKKITGIQDEKRLRSVFLIIAGVCLLVSFLVYIFFTPSSEGNRTLPVIYKEDVTPELEHLFTPEQLIDLPRKY